MPEEFKIWLEKMEAFEKRKAEHLANTVPETKAKPEFPPRPVKQPLKQPVKPQEASSEVPVYEDPTQAVAAFKELLEERDVSLTAKLKDVQDRCSDDARWNALRTTGEKKQALAEYQTWRLKQEKEEARARARRHKENFYLMLAETTEIDARSKFRDCASLLAEDPRFKAVEDNRLREDYFRDFVEELEKKQKQEMEDQRAEALKDFDSLLKVLSDEGKVTRKSIWANAKDDVSELAEAIANTKFKSLDITAMRRCFQSVIDDLDSSFKQTERAKREELKRQARTAQQKFIVEGLEPLVKAGEIRADSKWRVVANDNVSKWQDCKAYTTLVEVATQLEGQKSEAEAFSVADSSLFRECFDDAIVTVKERFREDRRLVRGALDAARFKISAESTVADMELKLKELAAADVSLEGLLSHRSWQLKAIFADLYDPVVKEKRAALEKQKKREERFVSLLEEYYFRSDHVDVTWDQAKRTLERHSAYDALERGDRRRLFDAHMNTLRAKLAEKKMAMAALQGLSIEGAEEGEVLDVPDVPPLPVKEVPRSSFATLDRAVGRGRELTLPAWMSNDPSKTSIATKVELNKSDKFADAAYDGIPTKHDSLNTPDSILTGGRAVPMNSDDGVDSSIYNDGQTADKRELELDEDDVDEKVGSTKPRKRARRSSRRK